MELARCYEHGIIVERNEKFAFELVNEAYTKNIPIAISYLARLYEEGIGTEQDLTKAGDLVLYQAKQETG